MPTPGDSYWVIEGRLLAGPYPGAIDPADAEGKLSAFLDAGVTVFVDLTDEKDGLRPYADLLRSLAARRGSTVQHVRLPIRDVDVPTERHMRTILTTVRRALAAGKLVYLHCWGGVGRTGTVVGCMLVEDGVPADDVLDRLRQLRARTARRDRPSPETDAQRDFVLGWASGRERGVDEAR